MKLPVKLLLSSIFVKFGKPPDVLREKSGQSQRIYYATLRDGKKRRFVPSALGVALTAKADNGYYNRGDQIDDHNLKCRHISADKHQYGATNPNGSYDASGVGVLDEKYEFLKHVVPPMYQLFSV
jgi:hypothetical protein